MDNGYCTILTKDRIYQGIALWYSLHQHAKEYTMFVLCMDDTAYHILSQLQTDKIILVPKDAVENYCPGVRGLSRKINEYCWTLKPVFLEYLLNHYPTIARVTYVDSDIYFLTILGSSLNIILLPMYYYRNTTLTMEMWKLRELAGNITADL